MLHVTLTVKHGKKDENLERLFERQKTRIVARLAGEVLASCSLHAEVDLSAHRREGYATLTLDMPSGAIAAHGKGRNHLAALRHATESLLEELAKHREKRRERAREASTIRPVSEHCRAVDVSVDPNVVDATERDSITHVLPELVAFAKKEIARHEIELALTDEVPIDAEDVADEALLKALATRADCPVDVPFDRYVFGCAFDVIVAEAERRRTLAHGESLETEVTPDVATNGFHHVDEPVDPLEDLPETIAFGEALADARSRDGGTELMARDLRYAVLLSIRHLPEDERRVLSLVALRGLKPHEAAKRLHRSEAEVSSLMERARDDVRKELFARGYA